MSSTIDQTRADAGIHPAWTYAAIRYYGPAPRATHDAYTPENTGRAAGLPVNRCTTDVQTVADVNTEIARRSHTRERVTYAWRKLTSADGAVTFRVVCVSWARYDVAWTNAYEGTCLRECWRQMARGGDLPRETYVDQSAFRTFAIVGRVK